MRVPQEIHNAIKNFLITQLGQEITPTINSVFPEGEYDFDWLKDQNLFASLWGLVLFQGRHVTAPQLNNVVNLISQIDEKTTLKSDGTLRIGRKENKFILLMPTPSENEINSFGFDDNVFFIELSEHFQGDDIKDFLKKVRIEIGCMDAPGKLNDEDWWIFVLYEKIKAGRFGMKEEVLKKLAQQANEECPNNKVFIRATRVYL
jgi:hypothetical protein